jgi:hypothetical protein
MWKWKWALTAQPKRWQEGDGAELRVGVCARARALEHGADGAQQDADQGAGEVRAAGQ